MQNPFFAVYGILAEYNKRQSIKNLPIKVDILLDIVRERCELKTIAYTEADAETKHVFGNVKFYYPVPKNIRTIEEPTTAIIKFRKEISVPMQRLVVCKELCHCLADTEHDHVTSVDAVKSLLEGLAGDLPPSIVGDGPLRSEKWALYLALELLCPVEFRGEHILMLRRDEVSMEQLAERYEIPLEFADIPFKNTSYYTAARSGRRNEFVSFR